MIESTVIAEVSAAAKVIADKLYGYSGYSGFHLRKSETAKSLEQQKSELVANLVAANIDPLVFDSLLANEIDRRLKIRFGVVFVALVVLFTTASYAIVVLNGPMGLKISDIAITGLIIETPIQFVGLLYIIARNLFPDMGGTKASLLKRKGRTEADEGAGLVTEFGHPKPIRSP